MIGFLTRMLPASLASLTSRGLGHRRIVANTGWLVTDNVINVVAGLFVGAWVARYLGPAMYGVYNYALAFVLLFSPIVGLGLKDIVVRDIVRSPARRHEILGTSFGLQSSAAVVTLALAVLVARFARPGDTVILWLVGILAARFLFQAVGDTLDFWFQSQVQAKYTVWARNIGLVLISVAKIGLILGGASLVAFGAAALSQAAITAAALVIFYLVSRQTLSSWRPNLHTAKELLRSSHPLIVSAVAITIYMRVGQVILGTLASEEQVGLYSAAARLSELWYFAPVAISSSVFPAIVRSLQTESHEKFARRMQLYYDVMAGLAYAVAIPTVILAPFLVRVLFGSDYLGAVPILRIHILAYVFISLGVARSRWLVAEDNIRFGMAATLLGAVVAIILNLILIPRYGGMGVAWAVLLSQAISTYLSSALSKRTWPALGQQSRSLILAFRLPSLTKALDEIL